MLRVSIRQEHSTLLFPVTLPIQRLRSLVVITISIRPPTVANQWHHIAVVFDGILERVYVDGELNNQSAKMLLMHEGRDIFIGASEPGVEHFSGYLSTLTVHDSALSPDTIRENAKKEVR